MKTAEEMKIKWDGFAAEFEAFSSWISDKEKQLDALKGSTLALEQQIETVKVPDNPGEDKEDMTVGIFISSVFEFLIFFWSSVASPSHGC